MASNVSGYISYMPYCLYYKNPLYNNIYSIRSEPNILKLEYNVIVNCLSMSFSIF